MRRKKYKYKKRYKRKFLKKRKQKAKGFGDGFKLLYFIGNSGEIICNET